MFLEWIYGEVIYRGRSEFRTADIWEDTQSRIDDRRRDLLEDEIRGKDG